MLFQMNTIDTQIIDRGSFPGSDFELTKWDRLVLRHTHPLNLWIHVLSMVMYFVAPVVMLLTGNLWWLLGPFRARTVSFDTGFPAMVDQHPGSHG